MNVKRERIADIECTRVIAAVVIMFYHMGYLPGGLLAVELFAILTGLLMARSLSKKSSGYEQGTLWQDMGRYVLGKVKVFYPELLIATAIGIIGKNYAKHPFDESMNYVMSSLINNVLLLKMSGIVSPSVGACPPVWYLSSMVISMLLIYPMMRMIRNSAIFLILGSVLFGYLYYYVGGVEQYHYSEWVGFTYGGNIRICSEMLIAVGFYPFIGKVKIWIGESRKRYTFVKICQFTALCGIFILFFHEHGKTDVIFLGLVIVYMIGAFSCASVQKSVRPPKGQGVIKYMGSVSIVIYLAHYPAMRIGGGVSLASGFSSSSHFVCVVLLTLVFSLLIYSGGKYLRSHFKLMC